MKNGDSRQTEVTKSNLDIGDGDEVGSNVPQTG